MKLEILLISMKNVCKGSRSKPISNMLCGRFFPDPHMYI